ncbi:ABC-2 type transport system permease protein [Streptohalobacillus salinus]|uniref:ABC-2 type transport system permease protein n=1 Tax=Streptohalobacillus salinus TaxID=621096 RepID=A0A2V3WQC0_9BACI|nr:ABC transporter permease [Streptohalobacillus salinus]PXW90899.1 ABC-2 type transport system permease protein [Streptohalobacillus salinus]
MIDIYRLQWKRLLKEPMLVLTFFGLTILFVVFLGQGEQSSTIKVVTYTEDLSEAIYQERLGELNQTDHYQFTASTIQAVEEDLSHNRMAFAVELSADNYRFLTGSESFSQPMTDQYLSAYYHTRQLLEANELTADDIDTYIELSIESSQAETMAVNYQIQVVVGMTLYFVMYTVLFQMMSIAEEKKEGTWDRIIIAPINKWQLYAGLFLFYYTVGLIQVLLSFVIFTQIIGFSFGSSYLALFVGVSLFLFSIVALGLMLVAFVKTPQQLQAVIPIVATASAMLGGAFWPIEFVTQPVILFMSRVIPIRYGIEALSEVIREGASVVEVIEPLGLLVLLMVVFGAIGLTVLERKAK